MKKLLLVCAMLCTAISAISADMTPAGSAAPSWRSQTRQLIEAKNFDQAINIFLQADEK